MTMRAARLAAVAGLAAVLIAGCEVSRFGGDGAQTITAADLASGSAPDLAPGTPAPRTFAAVAFDPDTRQTVMFGGLPAGGGSTSDTWIWDGKHWARAHPAVSPHRRDFARMAYDPQVHGLVLIGGDPNGPTDATVQSDMRATWIWNRTGWHRFDTVHSPLDNAQQPFFVIRGLAFDASSQRLVLVAEQEMVHTITCSAETWTFDGQDWHREKPRTALPATTRALAADSASGQLLAVEAGRAAVMSEGEASADCPPGSAAGASIPNSTWIWTHGNWHETTGPQPPPIPNGEAEDAGVADFNGRATLVAFHGEVWTWTGSGWVLSKGALSPPREHSAVAADHLGQLMVFSGFYQDAPPWDTTDTWVWNGSSWHRVA